MKRLLIVALGLSVIFSMLVLASGGSDSGQLTFGVTIETFDDVFMQGVLDAVREKGDELGVNIVTTDGKSDPAEQLKQIDNFVTTGVNAIIVHVINVDIASTINEKAISAGIPLVYMNRSPGEGNLPAGEMIAVVASPEEEAGAGQAAYVAGLMSSGNGVILLGGLGSSPQIGRTKGVEDYIAANASGIKITRKQTASWKRPDAVAVVENWLNAGDKIDVIFANNDEMAIGASIAVKEKGLKDQIIIVGVDASPDGIAALEAGDIDMTMFQNGAAQGAGSVEVAELMATGKSFEQNVVIPFEPVTAENASDYK